MLLLLADYLHRLDPFAIQFSESFGVRWYGLAYAAGFLVAYLLGRELARRRLFAVHPDAVGDYLMAGIIGVLAGGRLGYVLFYNPSAIWTFSDSFPFWEVLAVNRGGMASHGGMIGVILAVVWFARRERLPIAHIWDVSALLTPFGLFFGRLANFVNGELRGKPAGADFPLAVRFPQEIREDWGVAEMRRLDEIAGDAGFTTTDWTRTLDQAAAGDPMAYDSYLAMKERIIDLLQSGSPEVTAAVEPLITPRHPSQLYQALAEGIILATALWLIFLVAKPKRSGWIGVGFMLIYGALRVVTEIWRTPDEGVALVAGLSRGQQLSAVMLLVGLVYTAYILWRPSPSPWAEPPLRSSREASMPTTS
ncbi:MAG: prolipoprotein diacylglyceryl transferase [Phycisphaerales bacterium]